LSVELEDRKVYVWVYFLEVEVFMKMRAIGQER
jgi:hypothetical protein